MPSPWWAWLLWVNLESLSCMHGTVLSMALGGNRDGLQVGVRVGVRDRVKGRGQGTGQEPRQERGSD